MNTEIHWKDQQPSDASIPSTAPKGSVGSYDTHSTAPTEDSRPIHIPRSETCYGRLEGRGVAKHQSHRTDPRFDSRSSVVTYTSTIASEEEPKEEDSVESEYDIRVEPRPIHPTSAIAATPRDFADVFPASKRLLIGHDDSTSDGNLNLRLDSEVTVRGSKRLLTLFHLRMYDLRDREMSFRRYCRDSGREVCRSRRLHQNVADGKGRSPLQKKLGGALANFWPKPGSKDGVFAAKRHDSGYASSPVLDLETSSLSSSGSSTKALPETNTIKMEFSNYALVDLKRRGASAGQGKRYEFEYWGYLYEWKRHVARDNDRDEEEVSFHLFRSDGDDELARITPLHLSEAQIRHEQRNGGWISPCIMELLDQDLQSSQDVVVVATGLIALVDDSLKRRSGAKRSRPLILPLYRSASFRLNMEFVGPKRLLNEALHRPGHSRTASGNPTSLRRVSVEARGDRTPN
ncbi:hypothetical protein P152DRAFT_502186 [Eremomyces bilateralis CBS 781.70]|uniref:Uncharacterized protein n=1 Tax=Eremomyces bilateralis CBS 781.70 TaxID=1392243 RepID=A0A6G1G516_9PEZI|nr:uncharacterized protein P152DRAFT_502186 [Eremomyces bilateralis CBS 781.70]KAF1813167.1 hypothetical protein P152DRAFT_502186 [Eremomyces bilateralis CBS 781.70]